MLNFSHYNFFFWGGRIAAAHNSVNTQQTTRGGCADLNRLEFGWRVVSIGHGFRLSRFDPTPTFSVLPG